MKRSLRIASVVGLAVALLPLHAAAVQVESLTLSPSQGTPGSSFMATFDFAAAACNNWKVWFSWDQKSLGSVPAAGNPQACHATLMTTVPSGDMAVPGQSYRVDANAQALGGVSFDGGNGFGATAQYTVLGNSSPAGPASSASSTSSSATPHSSSPPAATSSSSTEPAAATSTTASATPPPPSSGVSGASASGPQPSPTPFILSLGMNGTHTQQLVIPARLWVTGGIILALLVGVAWVARGRLPKLPRRGR